MADLGAIGRNALPSGIRHAKKVSGTISLVGDITGVNVLGRRKVVLHRQSSGDVVNVNYSFADGSFSVPSTLAVENLPHYVVLLDDVEGAPLGALIYSDVYPV